MIELNVIKILLNNTYYSKYYNYIYNNRYIDNIKTNNKYLYKLFLTIKELKEESNTDHTVDDLVNCFYTLYPATVPADREVFDDLFQRIRSSDASEDTSAALLESFREVFVARELSTLALDVSEARKPFKELLEAFHELTEEQPKTSDSLIWEPDLEEIFSDKGEGKGLEWPLKCLNKSIGPLHKGDFGWIMMRPEVGKTAFLVSMVAHALKQTEGPILYVMNEEASKNVYLRIFYNYFGIHRSQLMASMQLYKEKGVAVGIDRVRFIDDAGVQRREIERIADELRPELIILDQLDKVHGFYNAQSHDLLMKAKYQWARELAKKHCPVIGTCQAGGSAEGKMWLDLDDADWSKTAKQGEADWIIGGGVNTNTGFEQMRYLSVLKNKLGNGPDCIEALRHGKFKTILEAEYSRYIDTDYQ